MWRTNPVVAGCGAYTRIGKQTRLGTTTAVEVRRMRSSDRVFLTVRHASTAIALLLTPDESDAVADALISDTPVPYLLAGRKP